MKIAVIGSRGYFKEDKQGRKNLKIETHFVEILARSFKEGDILVSGGARGVDSYAEQIIDEINLGVEGILHDKKIFKPDWDKYGKRAGFLRNELIVKEADKVIAFWDGSSKGTKHSIDLAIKVGKPVDIYIR